MNKKIMLLLVLLLQTTFLGALSPKDIILNETAEEIKVKKSKFLSIEEKDLLQYEKLIHLIDLDTKLQGKTLQGRTRLKAEFESYLSRRLNMIRKVFIVFRSEFEMILKHLESQNSKNLPSYRSLTKILLSEIDEAKFKGSKEKWKKLNKRARKIYSKANDESLNQKYLDNLVLKANSSNKEIFEAQTRLLHRWLIENNLFQAQEWIKTLYKARPEDPLCLALMSHLHLEKYKIQKNMPDMEGIIENNLKKKFGSAVFVKMKKTDDHLQKSFLFYVEALKRGFPQEKEIPELLPFYWKRVSKMFEKVYPYWSYPTSFDHYREHMQEMCNHCKAIIQNVPFKKYGLKAYDILLKVYKYWPSQAGKELIGYFEINKMSREVSRKKL